MYRNPTDSEPTPDRLRTDSGPFPIQNPTDYHPTPPQLRNEILPTPTRHPPDSGMKSTRIRTDYHHRRSQKSTTPISKIQPTIDPDHSDPTTLRTDFSPTPLRFRTVTVEKFSRTLPWNHPANRPSPSSPLQKFRSNSSDRTNPTPKLCRQKFRHALLSNHQPATNPRAHPGVADEKFRRFSPRAPRGPVHPGAPRCPPIPRSPTHSTPLRQPRKPPKSPKTAISTPN